jgi:purine-nucleoside phosphorylase
MGDEPFAEATSAARAIASETNVEAFDVAIVLGSGWGSALDAFGRPSATIAMADLPGFPAPTVVGHAGTVSTFDVGGTRVLVLAGRSHLYEGHSPATVVHGVRAAILAGCRTIVLTNAAGSLRPEWPIGAPVLIADHLNLTGHSPLVGPPPPGGFPARFADLTDAYSRRLRALALSIEPAVNEGVYAALLGGSYETPAEIAMLRSMGADLVGMSTALETIAAVHLGAEVLGLSLVTNLAAGLSAAPLDHNDVLAAGAAAASDLGPFLRAFVERLS